MAFFVLGLHHGDQHLVADAQMGALVGGQAGDSLLGMTPSDLEPISTRISSGSLRMIGAFDHVAVLELAELLIGCREQRSHVVLGALARVAGLTPRGVRIVRDCGRRGVRGHGRGRCRGGRGLLGGSRRRFFRRRDNIRLCGSCRFLGRRDDIRLRGSRRLLGRHNVRLLRGRRFLGRGRGVQAVVGGACAAGSECDRSRSIAFARGDRRLRLGHQLSSVAGRAGRLRVLLIHR